MNTGVQTVLVLQITSLFAYINAYIMWNTSINVVYYIKHIIYVIYHIKVSRRRASCRRKRWKDQFWTAGIRNKSTDFLDFSRLYEYDFHVYIQIFRFGGAPNKVTLI